MLPGYFQGKKRAEESLALKFPEGGVALRPGFIYGTRNVAGIGIPLGAIGALTAFSFLISISLRNNQPCLTQHLVPMLSSKPVVCYETLDCNSTSVACLYFHLARTFLWRMCTRGITLHAKRFCGDVHLTFPGILDSIRWGYDPKLYLNPHTLVFQTSFEFLVSENPYKVPV